MCENVQNMIREKLTDNGQQLHSLSNHLNDEHMTIWCMEYDKSDSISNKQLVQKLFPLNRSLELVLILVQITRVTGTAAHFTSRRSMTTTCSTSPAYYKPQVT